MSSSNWMMLKHSSVAQPRRLLLPGWKTGRIEFMINRIHWLFCCDGPCSCRDHLKALIVPCKFSLQCTASATGCSSTSSQSVHDSTFVVGYRGLLRDSNPLNMALITVTPAYSTANHSVATIQMIDLPEMAYHQATLPRVYPIQQPL